MNFQSKTDMSHDLFYATNFNILTDIDLTPNTRTSAGRVKAFKNVFVYQDYYIITMKNCLYN